MSVKVEKISNDKCQLGESPFWDEKSQSVYYVDIFGKTVNRYTPSTKTNVKAVVGDKNVSFIIPIEAEDEAFLIGYGNEIAKLIWDGVSDRIGSLETVVELKNTEERSHRWNDGKADPFGRLWAGVFIPTKGGGFTPSAGSLYALNRDKTLTELASNITVSNGLAWDVELKKFYYIDTGTYGVYQYDYENGEISNRQVIFKFSELGLNGGPDGMTIDSDGNLWVASFGDGKILKINPKVPNTLLQTVDVPVEQVTCVEFFGPNYDELFVTTAGIPFSGRTPEGGWSYKITGLGVKGLPARRVKL